MRILLVRPPRMKQAITLGEFMFSEPIGLECVYSVLKDRHEIRLLDMMAGKEAFAEVFQSFKPQVVGITSLCIDVEAVWQLAEEAKSLDPAVVTLVGGTQALLRPESFFNPAIDHVFKYTTVENLNRVFSYLENSQPVPPIHGVCSRENNYAGAEAKGFNDYIVPDRTSTAKYRRSYSYFGFSPCAILQTSRGCSSACSFCLRWRIEGYGEKDEPLEAVILQIEQIEETNIMIFDNNFLYSASRLQRFCELLEQRGIHKNFICYASAESIVNNYAAVKRFVTNGLRAVLVGYESFAESELRTYNKKASVEINRKAAGILKELGVDCWASFILNPDWEITDFQKFRKYIRELRPEISSLSPLTPFPGSPMYQKYRERIIFKVEDYKRWSFSEVSIRPSRMSMRRYYLEVLKTNLYVNLFLNNGAYMVKKFGLSTVLRILKGSLRILLTYIKLMLKG